jgi:hypothetical protein
MLTACLAVLCDAEWGLQCDKDLNPSSPPPASSDAAPDLALPGNSACDKKSEASCLSPTCVW